MESVQHMVFAGQWDSKQGDAAMRCDLGAEARGCVLPIRGGFPRNLKTVRLDHASERRHGLRRNTAKVTLYLYAVVGTTADAVDRIALVSGAGNDSASGTAGDVQQSAAAPVPSPRGGFDIRPPVTCPLSE